MKEQMSESQEHRSQEGKGRRDGKKETSCDTEKWLNVT